MNMKQRLDWFQLMSEKTMPQLGYTNGCTWCIFGMIVEMKNICLGAEKHDSVLIHQHMGKATYYLANFCTVNNLKLSEIVADKEYDNIERNSFSMDLEEYLEMYQKELVSNDDFSEESKIAFVEKVWVAIFPEDYHRIFIRIDRILNQNVEALRIEQPEKFNSITES